MENFISILGWYLPTEYILSLTLSVFIDGIFLSVNTEGINNVYFLWIILLMELLLDSKKKSRTLTCHLYQQNCWWIDKQNNFVGNS